MLKTADLSPYLEKIKDFLLSKSDGYTSIEVSPSCVTLLQLNLSSDRKKVQFLTALPLKSGIIHENSIENTQALAEIIAKAKELEQEPSHNAALSIESDALMTKSAKMPAHVKAAHQEAYVHAEARKLFPGVSDQLYLDFSVDETIDPKDTSKNNLTLFATYKKKIQPLIESVEKAGYQAKILDIDYCALERTYPLIAPQLPADHVQHHTAMINIDTHAMLMIVMHDGKMTDHHYQTYNGAMLRNLVHHHLGLKLDSEPEEKEPDADASAFEITFAQGEQLTNQIEHLLQTLDSTIQLKHLVLSGRCAVIPKLAELVQEKTDIPTCIANPFSNMEHSSKIDAATIQQHAPAFLINCGLALHGPITW